VATTANPASGVYLSAFKDAAATQVAVVVINTGAQTTLGLSIDSGSFGTLTQYRTSSSENLASVGTVARGATVTVTLAASSVTFVGPVSP
jgi:glucuronoarabinoxylan endo-1,4-beta-xylanase